MALSFGHLNAKEREGLQGLNCIIVYNETKDKILLCHRTKEPYLGLYNVVGGKIEEGEDHLQGAYRELEEETGITMTDMELKHVMDFTYYYQKCYIEVYAGYLRHQVKLKPEKHPLFWADVDGEYFSMEKYAGEGNIGHMLEQVKMYWKDIMEDK